MRRLLSPEQKKVTAAYRMSPWIIEKLEEIKENTGTSIGKLIEAAVVSKYALKPPRKKLLK